MSDPLFLRNLFERVSSLPGVGPSAAKSYEAMGIKTKSDLLALSPRSYEDHSSFHPIDSVAEGEYAYTKVQVLRHDFFGANFKKRTLKITVRDVEGRGEELSLLCFGRNFLAQTVLVGNCYFLYGQIQTFHGRKQCSQFELKPAQEEDFPPDYGKILPIYPLHGSLSQRLVRKNVDDTLKGVSRFHEELSDAIREDNHLETIDWSIRKWHQPFSLQEREMARKTLAFDELFYMQMCTRRNETGNGPRKNGIVTPLEQKFIESLPFALTPDQMTSLKEIRSDLDNEEPMNRLLQGDVGSGKTLVAWISALHALAPGHCQVAFMAPTELLARQHADSAQKLLAPFGVRMAFITGAVKGKERTLLLQNIKEGNVDIVIGTHAIFSKEVEFKHLTYVIIDEQHRFGVEQRLALTGKANVPDLLLMTATPIPRTLSLTVFGSLGISSLKTMPPGRKPVITYSVKESSRQRMYNSISVEFGKGHQAYFVYPRIDDSGQSDLRDVTTMYEFLKKQYPGVPSALMHSKLDEEEKMTILQKFKAGELQYLVSTSVVEVGIDIPNATCMVIEHAERFGLAALHQLRGRVGRSSLQSYCFLVFGDDLSEDAKQRLNVMKQTTDGFVIAEKDLSIRGPGDIGGIRQSGYFNLHFADLTSDIELLEQSHKAVNALLADDPGLLKAENAVIRETMGESPLFLSPSAS